MWGFYDLRLWVWDKGEWDFGVCIAKGFLFFFAFLSFRCCIASLILGYMLVCMGFSSLFLVILGQHYHEPWPD